MKLKLPQLLHVTVGIIGLLMLLLPSPCTAGGKVTDPEQVKNVGERIYREGRLSDGTALTSRVKEDIVIDSTMFSCANCHTRSGVGSVEGQIVSPPITGKALFNPRYLFRDNLKTILFDKKGGNYKPTPLRPAYTDETLADAILRGMSPIGKELSPVMPRYDMGDKDLEILIGYLKGLSAEYSPGVTDTTLRFATIISDALSAEEREGILLPLERFVNQNRQSAELKKTPQYAKMGRMLDEAFYRSITIDTWELKGPSTTWRAQLEEYNRKQPVFAILGGMTGGDWQPVHDFCEDNRIPNLFPITDFPVISDRSWYTFYFSKGFYQEGETAARYITGNREWNQGESVLQVASDTREGRALAAGFTAAYKEVGPELETVFLPGANSDGETLKQLLEKRQAGTVVLWLGPEVIQLLEHSSGEKETPKRIFLSGRYLDKAMKDIPDRFRDRVFMTYPYRLPDSEKKFVSFANTFSLGGKKDDKRISSRMFSMLHMLVMGLKELKLDYYRDALIDVISMRPDQHLPDYERLSFGPGQRYASKGCYIVQLEKGKGGQLVKKSGWVIF